MKESTLQAYLLYELNKRPNCKAIAITVGEYMEVGTPDVLACIDTIMYFLEVKQKGKKASPIQIHRMAEWEQAGATCWLLAGKDQVDSFLNNLGNDGVCSMTPNPEPSGDNAQKRGE